MSRKHLERSGRVNGRIARIRRVNVLRRLYLASFVAGIVSVAAGCSAPYQARLVSEPSTDWATEEHSAAFGRNPSYAGARLSPDGTRIVAIQSSSAEDSIVVFSGEDFQTRETLITERRSARGARSSRRIRLVGWPSDDLIIFSIGTTLLSREDGIEKEVGRNYSTNSRLQRGRGLHARKSRLYRLRLDGRHAYLGKRWTNGPESQYQDQIVDWLPHDSEHFLINFEGSLVRVRAQNGTRFTVRRGSTFSSDWVVDHEGTPRARAEYKDGTRDVAWQYRSLETRRWIEAIRFDRYTESGFSFSGFDSGAGLAYVYSNVGTDHVELREFDLNSGKLGKLIARDPAFDLDTGGLWFSNQDGRLIAVEYMGVGLERIWVDREFEADWAPVATRFEGENVAVINASRDDRRVLLQVDSPIHPPRIFLFDRQARRLIHIFDEFPDLSKRDLASYQFVSFRARDGLRVPGYFASSPSADPTRPLVVVAHDGPEGRMDFGYDPIVQFLVARGFNVFLPNYRGSSGFGTAFLQKGDGELGRAMQWDLVDGVKALHDQGLATPRRVGTFGVGYGGFLALNAVVQTPEIFDSAATWGALTDLSLHEARRRKLFGASEVDKIILGTGREYENRKKEISPARAGDRVGRPVLLGHGSENPYIDPTHLKTMSKSLEEAGAEYEAILYEGQLREFVDERARIDFYFRLADFFERTLGSVP